ncbi:MAG TPA: YkgJ family cysteine cluster protein [Vicinamibacteria bacterium]|nr:YkgJ family cysteine cluster protein [Vicinamibacteria bacterium]
MPTSIDVADLDLLASLQRSLSQAEAACAGRLDYGRGCPRCCYGPFPINALDARRLRRGLAVLHERDAERARAIAQRARRSAARLAEAFPGAAGRLAEDDDVVEAFCARFAAEPCPALDTVSGRCELYESRPLACRTFGPPVRIGEHELPPCDWCFVGSTEEAHRAAAPIDPERREGVILDRLEADGAVGDTVIAFALADGP